MIPMERGWGGRGREGGLNGRIWDRKGKGEGGEMRVGTQRGEKEGKQTVHLGGDTALHE